MQSRREPLGDIRPERRCRLGRLAPIRRHEHVTVRPSGVVVEVTIGDGQRRHRDVPEHSLSDGAEQPVAEPRATLETENHEVHVVRFEVVDDCLGGARGHEMRHDGHPHVVGQVNAGRALFITSTDFYPTILEMAGLAARPQQHLDGISLVPLLRGQSFDRGTLYWHYPHYGNQGASPGSVIREGDWKLIEWADEGKVELFNLARDPGEQRDLAGERKGQVANLRKKLQAWRKETGALQPVPNPNYDPDKRSGRGAPRRNR